MKKSPIPMIEKYYLISEEKKAEMEESERREKKARAKLRELDLISMAIVNIGYFLFDVSSAIFSWFYFKFYIEPRLNKEIERLEIVAMVTEGIAKQKDRNKK